MREKLMVSLALCCVVTLAGHAQDAKPILEAAATALGARNLTSIEFSGRGSDYIFGQAYDANSPWPRFNVPSFTMSIDYATPAMRDERRRAQVQNPPLGGGFQPLVGELRQIWVMSGTYAWDVVGTSAVAAAPERDQRPATEGRLAQVWLTPHGFIKAATSNSASVKTETVRGATKTVVSFTTPTQAKFTGVLNDQHLVEHIETWLDNPVLGDTKFEASFKDYKDFGGVKFPTHILQREGGYPVLDLTITDVKPNANVAIEVPANIRGAKPPVVQALEPEKLSDGLWIIPGGAKSLVVEFRDHVVIIDAPETEARSTLVMDAVKKIVPTKPIKYVINTHSHFDHSGGLRTYAADGATIITHHDNVPYYEQVWASPRTIRPDRLAKSGRKATFEGVVGSRALRDETRELVIYHYPGNMHNAGMLMVYLPKEKILVEADSYTPPANANDPPGAVPNLVHFYEAVQRLKLDIDQIVPIHGRLATEDDVRNAIEAYRHTQTWPR